MSADVHYIMRICFSESNPDHRKVVRAGLSLDDAQAHCQDDRTSGDGWGDHYYIGEYTADLHTPVATAPLPEDLKS